MRKKEVEYRRRLLHRFVSHLFALDPHDRCYYLRGQKAVKITDVTMESLIEQYAREKP